MPRILFRLRYLLMLLAVLALQGTAMIAHAQENNCTPGCICLLEPLPNGDREICKQGNNPLDVFEQWLNTGGIWAWALAVGVGLAVLNVTIGGFQIMVSNGDQGRVTQGKERIVWSIVGLLLLMFAGVILNFLNPNAFSQS